MNSSADHADIAVVDVAVADVAVVVVSHESASTLEDCLLRLRAARGVAEIRVVDNASLDGTLDIIQRHAAMDSPGANAWISIPPVCET